MVADGIHGYVEASTEDLVPNPKHACKGNVPRVDKVFASKMSRESPNDGTSVIHLVEGRVDEHVGDEKTSEQSL